MAPTSSSGGMIALYGVVLQDKCRTASLTTLRAYKAVAADLLKDSKGAAAGELREAVKSISAAISAKGKKKAKKKAK